MFDPYIVRAGQRCDTSDMSPHQKKDAQLKLERRGLRFRVISPAEAIIVALPTSEDKVEQAHFDRQRRITMRREY